MKRYLVAFLAVTLFISAVAAQTTREQEVNYKFMLNPQGTVSSNVYFGIFTQDIDSDVAEELGYPEDWGLLISDVVEDTPAWKIGLQANDIITKINDEQVYDQEVFDRIRGELQPGDVITLQIWREGRTQDLQMTMQPRPAGSEVTKTVSVTRKGSNYGYGGGSWMPYWFTQDVEDVNELLTGLGFQAIKDDGMLMQGFGGKGHVGKGFFIGGLVASNEDSYTIADPVNPAFHSWMRYSTSFGGVTLDKRIPLAQNFVGSLGLMVGGGGHELELIHGDAQYNWPAPGTAFTTNNYHATINRMFITVQPRAELLFMVLPWLGFRAEAGYLYGYAPKEGWRVKGLNNDNFVVNNSPNTPMQGLTFSVGPWFGF